MEREPVKRSGELKRRTPLKGGGALQRGTPSLPRTPLARTTRVKPQSEKRVVAAALRRVLVAHLLAEFPRCQGQWVCRGARAVDVHERLKRSRGGIISDADQAHMVTLCRPCHEMTEAEPLEATRRRLLLPSWHKCPPIGPC